MATIRLRILVEELDDTSRDVELKSTQNFKDLHEAIVKYFDIKSKRAATFFTSNNKWQKLNEISIGQGESMENAINGLEETVAKIIDKKAKQLIYFNENTPQYTFLIDYQSSGEEKEGKSYPRCAKSVGSLSSMAGGFADDIFDDSGPLHIDNILEEPEDDDFF